VIEILETALSDLATDLVPDSSTVAAVVDQWIQSLLTESQPYGCASISIKALKKVARENGVNYDSQEFRDAYKLRYPLACVDKGDFTFIDLFAGIGGMRLGFQSAGGRCVFSSEFEKNAQHTYQENYGEYPFGDITKVPPHMIPDHDVLLAGFPCQPFSHAGLKLGVEDTRGTLFYDISRILTVKRPKLALLENVKGLVSHDSGNTLFVILRTLVSIGYRCIIPSEVIEAGSVTDVQMWAKKMVLKSCDFGVPQNRQRIYIVLWREDLEDGYAYPKPKHNLETRVGDILEESVPAKYTISDRLWAGHQRRKADNARNGKGFGFGLVSPDSPYANTISARYYKDGSEILIVQTDEKNPRKLTEREAARLQGFPDEFIVSKSTVQAYKQFGNSVSVPVIAAIAKSIKEKFL
jgi:DNA (cytosine-5)-methyltransferase 1